MELIKLWLVDDHALLTEALTTRLAAFSDLWVAGRSASDDPRLPTKLAQERPTIITVEPEAIRVPQAELFATLRAAAPEARLVALTGSKDPARALAAARAGADAWISKASGMAHLVEVLRGVARGDAWFPPRLLGVVLRGLRDDLLRGADGPLDALSGREREVLECMVDGMRGPQIAAELGLSTNTVRTHTHSVYAKLGVHSRLQAVSAARAAGLLPRAKDPVQTS
ncbi:helix-turn-helix transcriptional regulator [Actinokineospora globicatena]|uniref:Transcriptional regulator n=1 Tax=Actinokineospora globicatena TaxID=103729 RepID=A0A9W6QTY3_9PSEU|nr:response regulator transcription factor [Actinokineospora globicatena]MCP2305571.1 two component transcriptional regulator, LuxR family [Actinokineospora globicatena]GLW81441.1 transcriptional regulator [Actinokineospora globicatena]GLW87861.1 transcriptional regulator [Actinokineospora globicatena]GLW94539.1 transcriptional regulator [Actinokineospora globicatena]